MSKNPEPQSVFPLPNLPKPSSQFTAQGFARKSRKNKEKKPNE